VSGACERGSVGWQRHRKGSFVLRLDPIACDGRGMCAELLPELVDLDDWGYPVLSGDPIPPEILAAARRAASACPTLALRLERPDGGLQS
jgi:ferredoxin